MTSEQIEMLSQAEDYVKSFFKKHCTKDFTFHNIGHTFNVIQSADIIAEYEKVSEDDKFILLMACYFHDVGYCIDTKNHEEESKKNVIEFLNKMNITQNQLNAILGCIDATKIPQNPTNNLERIICDADLYHLSQDHFIESSITLCKEWNVLGSKNMDKADFLPQTLQFLKDHEYKTRFGKKHLEKKKRKNIQLVEMEIENMNIENHKKKKKKNVDFSDLSKQSKKQLSSGISSMFRITGRMQINLSSIADSKSGLLISVNAILISLIVSYILGTASQNLMLIIPALILLFTSLVTIILAILAARPTISSGEFTREDIEQRKVNLLFFGNFYKMSLDEYDWAIREMMNDADYLYGNMIRDQYSLGRVLAKKYKHLRWAFNVFMGGLILASIAFIIMLIVV